MKYKPEPYLIALFNAGWDYVRKLRGTDHHYVGAPKSKATHRLHCSRWNANLGYIQDVKSRLRAERTRPDGYALAVAAIPLRRRKLPKPSEVLRRHIPKGKMPVFDRQGSLAGQRSVLSSMVEHHPTPTKMRKQIKSLGREGCYRLYRVLRRASQRAEHRAARLARRQARKGI